MIQAQRVFCLHKEHVASESEIAADVPQISREELQTRLRSSSIKLLDVMPAASYAEGHIPGALSIPLERIADEVRALIPDPNAEIVVYCAKFT